MILAHLLNRTNHNDLSEETLRRCVGFACAYSANYNYNIHLSK